MPRKTGVLDRKTQYRSFEVSQSAMYFGDKWWVRAADGCVQLYLCFRWPGLRPHLWQTSTWVARIMCDSNHFTFAEWNRWSVLYDEKMKKTLDCGARVAGGGVKWEIIEKKQHLASLLWWIDELITSVLIKGGFVFNTEFYLFVSNSHHFVRQSSLDF